MATSDHAPTRPPQDRVALVVEIELAPGEELRGSIGRRGEPMVLRFHGWIDFMAAVSTLRRS
jgi:hypothetical protein